MANKCSNYFYDPKPRISIYAIQVPSPPIFGHLFMRQRHRSRVYEYNDNIFAQDNEIAFYAAGFIAADGCIKKDKNNYCVALNLASADKEHLEKIRSILETTAPIHDYANGKFYCSKLNIYSDQIVEDLKRFNIGPRKSKTYTFPQWLIHHTLVNHFMRGYNDGDGSFYIQHQFNKKICFSLIGTPIFLCDYRAILEDKCNFKHRTAPIPLYSNCDMGRLNYGGNDNIIKILEFLYQDSTIQLDRKYAIAKLAYDFIKDKYKQNA